MTIPVIYTNFALSQFPIIPKMGKMGKKYVNIG